MLEEHRKLDAACQLVCTFDMRPFSSALGSWDIRQLILALKHIVEEDEHRGVEEVRPAVQQDLDEDVTQGTQPSLILPIHPVSLLQASQLSAHLTLLWSPRNVMKFLSPAYAATSRSLWCFPTNVSSVA